MYLFIYLSNLFLFQVKKRPQDGFSEIVLTVNSTYQMFIPV